MIRTLWTLLLVAGVAAPLSAGEIGVSVRDPDGNPVEDAVVLAKPLSPGDGSSKNDVIASAPAEPPTATITQVDLQFRPFVTVVPVGAKIYFPNEDNVLHSVYSVSKAKTFELPLYKDKSPRPVLFDSPGVVILGCNIHDWMAAYVYITETPFFAKTDADGRATLHALRAGEYEVEAWHPRKKRRGSSPGKRLRLEAGGTVQAEFVVGLKPDWRPRAPR